MATATTERQPTTISPVTGANGHAPRRALTRDKLLDALMREEGKAEIIDGRIVQLDVTGHQPTKSAGKIYFALMLWQQTTGATGDPLTDGAAFLCRLAHRQSFSPDAAYYTGAPAGMKFLPTTPVFAVEVRSEGDYGATMEQELEAKRADYFACETEVVWDVDLQSTDAVVRKYTRTGGAQTPVTVYKRGDIADAEPAVPGFTMPVDELFT